MIKRLKHRRTHGTLVANPRRKKRSSSRKRRSLRAVFANPRKKRRKAKNPSPLFRRKHKAIRRRKARHPGLAIGGLDLVSVGVGSVAAIALGAVGQGILNKYLSNTIQNETLGNAMPSLLVAAGAFAVHKYVANQKVKNIAKVTLVLSIFKAIDDSVGKKIQETVKDALPGVTGGAYLGTSGAFVPALRGYTGGAYMDQTGGAYLGTSGLLASGSSLYGL